MSIIKYKPTRETVIDRKALIDLHIEVFHKLALYAKRGQAQVALDCMVGLVENPMLPRYSKPLYDLAMDIQVYFMELAHGDAHRACIQNHRDLLARLKQL